jgi:hypothetical protein
VSAFWPWLALAGLGAYHGLNPAMGWLFAVALGLHRGRQAVVFEALVPIALGHALAVLIVALAVVSLGIVVDVRAVQAVAGVTLIGWAIWHSLTHSRQRVRFGMQVSMAGLATWSFLVATTHGAGLMLIPALVPLCLAASPARELTATGSLPVALAAVAVHTIAMLTVTAAIAFVVYRWVGVAVLRRGWINLDLLWIIALVATGFGLLLAAGL